MAATNKRGVFSLETVLERQSDNHWSKIPEVFRYVNSLGTAAVSGGPAYGYFAGGESNVGNSDVSTIDRLDYASDTSNALAKSKLNTPAPWIFGSATSNTSYGWFGSAKMGTSLVERLDFENDTANTSPKGNLSQARYYLAGTGNADYGYFIGGSTPSESSTIDRIDYSNDTATAAVKGPLSTARRITGATGNQSFGYAGGGATGNGGPDVTTVDRIDYSNDTPTTSLKGPLSSARQYHTAHGNANFGYFVGDKGNGAPGGGSVIDRIDYGNDTATASPKGSLSPDVGYFSGTGSASFGYSGGGSPKNSRINRIDYSNDTTVTTPVGYLSSTRAYLTGAVSGQESGLATAGTPITPATRTESGTPSPVGTNYGYYGAGSGDGSNPRSWVDRIDFDNDTATSSPKGNLASEFEFGAGSSSTSHGYFVGGTSTPKQSYINRIDYANDTATASNVGNLTEARTNAIGTHNSSYGYHAGGYNGSSANTTIVDRIDYANDSGTATPKGNLDLAVGSPTGVSNQSYGYYATGYNPAISDRITNVKRIDYSNDTATASPKGPITYARSSAAGAGNSDYGYIGTGYKPGGISSIMDRIDYSNDTATALARGPFFKTNNAYWMGATGNSSYGYWAGDEKNFDGSEIGRLDYSSDTSTALVKGLLSRYRQRHAGISPRANANPTALSPSVTVDKGADGYLLGGIAGPAFGYITGGAYPGVSAEKSTIDRIDFENDTATASPKGNTSEARKTHGAAGNTTHGYNFGGFGPSSTTDRIDYANDTATAAPKGTIASEGPAGKGYVHTGGTVSFGYIAGGYVPSSYGSPTNRSSTIDRLDYSNDSANTLSKGGLSDGRSSGSFTGNQSFGYQCGGKNPGVVSTVFRIDYGNDTATAATKGPLSATRRYNAATGNASFGYVASTGGNSDTSVDRIDYSNDTATASPKGPLSAASRYMGATSTSSFGYFAGGQNSSSNLHSRIDRIDYSSDTSTTSPKGNLSIAKNKSAGVSARQSGLPSGNFIPRIRWVDSATEVPAASVGPAFAYFSAGTTYPGPSPLSSTERLDYNNDTATASPKGPLNAAKYGSGMTGNATHGYVGGGGPAHGISTVERIDYSSDTDTAAVKGPLNQSTYMISAMSSLTHGYWCAGTDYPSRVSRVDFSNDTATASYVGNLDHVAYAYNVGAAGNTTHGYVIGGSNAATSKVTRIDFSNDSAVSTPVGNLPTKNTSFGTAGNANFAYTGGGEPGNYTSVVNRIDYSNDTASALVRGPLTSIKSFISASGNANFGYFVGGKTPVLSTIDRIDYSNDTATASTKGPLGLGRRFMGTTGASAKANAYPQEVVVAPVQPPFPYPVQSPKPAMSLTLESSDSSRLGDTTSVINTWWGTQTYDSELVTNIGEQSYQGFYAFTTGKACTITATLGGAAGWSNSRGRSITATFSISAGTRIVFFAGKPTEKYTSGQEVGAAGGASCLMVYDTSATSDDDYVNGFYPLIIAAGGSAAGNNPTTKAADNFRTIEAVPLATTTDYSQSNLVAFRNASFSSAPAPSPASQSDFDGGAGRNGTQTGGSGWKYAAINYGNGSIADSGNAVSLAYGATGMLAQGSGGADGGFGGGGGDADGNFYGSGGGGYYGGFESSGGHNSGSSYYTYGGPGGTSSYDDRGGPLSFVHSSGTSVTDNGLHGETSAWNDQDNADQIKGRVHLVIQEA